jgi:S-DNA-T family DNA segregation ATPase FtsK/SpoIIIE
MAKKTAKKAASPKPGGDVGLIRRLPKSPLWWLRFLGPVTILAVLGVLHEFILDKAGFGIVLVLAWVVVLGWIVWRRQVRTLARWWNFWLGAAFLTVTVWGVLAVFHPSGFVVSDVDFGTVSLGGVAGTYIVGDQGTTVWAVLRIIALLAAGVFLIVPYPSLRATQLSARAGKTVSSAAASGLAWLLPFTARRSAGAYQRHPLHRMMPAWTVAVLDRIRPAPAQKVPAAPGPAPAGGVPAELEPTPTSTFGVQLPLQPVEGEEAHDRPEADSRREAPRTPASARGQLPSVELLDVTADVAFTQADNEQRARLIEEALASYGVEAKVVQISPGPSVTQFGIEPGWARKFRRVIERDQQGKPKLDKDGNPVEKLEEVSKTRVKVEQITSLSNNLALALATPNIRIEAPVPGKPVVGLEVPNTITSVVRLRGVVESTPFQKVSARSKLAIALGRGAAGEPVAGDLSKMPHLLIAGTTGSGKTVCINSIIACLLMCNAPESMRLLLIDPKRVELVGYNGIPHLISPVVVDVERAIETLRRVIREMDTRFSKFAAVGVRNIEGYNRSPLVADPMPYLVVIVDELADLMMSAAEVVEPAICRLAQLARATGIHLVLATQRPSVDVVTGLIKANFPTRISFAVASAVDSRTILDIGGAEKLLGQGDMLYVPPEASKPKRLRGCFVADREIDRITSFWKQPPDVEAAHEQDRVAEEFASLEGEEARPEDPLLVSARRLAKEHSHLSTSLLQRRLHIGYPRAARIMDLLEDEGTVTRGDDAGLRARYRSEDEEAE